MFLLDVLLRGLQPRQVAESRTGMCQSRDAAGTGAETDPIEQELRTHVNDHGEGV